MTSPQYPDNAATGYPDLADADFDWCSEEDCCIHGVPWDEDCQECNYNDKRAEEGGYA